MHRGERTPQTISVGWHQDEMNVIGHQAPGPDRDIGSLAAFRQEVAVERVVVVAEEHAGTTIAALGDEVRQSWNNNAGKTSHGGISQGSGRTSIDWTVTVALFRTLIVLLEMGRNTI